MTKEAEPKKFSGKFEVHDLIEPTRTAFQYQSALLVKMGMDTEMLVQVDGKILWPHMAGFPQQRKPKDLTTSDGGSWFDFHGDGYATELCTEPVHCLEHMMERVGAAFKWLANRKVSGTYDRIKIVAPARYEVPQDVEEQATPDMKQLGCSPSRNIYGDAGQPDSLKPTERTTGCHLHISHPNLKLTGVADALVKWADVLVGSAWTYITPQDVTEEAARRKAYGRAGEHRLKTYPVWPHSDATAEYSAGVEYRVLPGTVMHHPAYMTLMFNLYRNALFLAWTKGEPPESFTDLAREAINDSNKEKAKKALKLLPINEDGWALLNFMNKNPLYLDGLNNWYLGYSISPGHQNLFNKTVKPELVAAETLKRRTKAYNQFRAA